MEWFEAILLGLVQGLTEFLPVSSSGHLAIGRELLGVEASDDLVFEVAVHAATVLSTIVVFRKQIWGLLQGLFRFRYNDETDYILKIGISMIPVFVVGVFFKDFVTGLFGSLSGVAVALLVTAILLLFSDFASRAYDGAKSVVRTNPYRNGISYWQAFVVGLGQAVAVVPGLSRSGTTIATGLICGVKRDVMAQFSFLMVLVPILGEAFLDVVGGDMAASSVGMLPLALGFLSAFVSGLFACKVMIALVKRAKLYWFAIYCVAVAVAIFILG
ncbi:MAG: undecaprenyl-diphosphate phosphatase [Bacteroidales bacterium]|nr:undecaprenyl-diphosphate phosphatase [Bacteroidales bacterium]MDE7126340.1 undecaprenyl-diphosphate phosphatase [Bacteroidales bacterium]